MNTPLPSRFHDDGQDWPPFRLTPPDRPWSLLLTGLAAALGLAALCATGLVLVDRKRAELQTRAALRVRQAADPAGRDAAAQETQATDRAMGQAVFARYCIGCHSGNPAAMNAGPDLAAVGEARSADWIAGQARDPKTHDPASAMPAFADKLTADEVRAVAAYLADRK